MFPRKPTPFYYPPKHLVFLNTQTMTNTENLQEMTKEDFLLHAPLGNCYLPKDAQLVYTPPQLQFQLLHPESKLPTRATDGSAGMDLYCHDYKPYGDKMLEYFTGVAVAIPEGYVGLVFPRSSISGTNHRLANGVGVIDSDFRGEIRLRFDVLNYPDSSIDYDVGDKIGQLLIIPAPIFTPTAVESLPLTTRGEQGFGSSGR